MAVVMLCVLLLFYMIDDYRHVSLLTVMTLLQFE